MKIREVACDRFAGLRLKDPLSFQDGINVVYGKNESGKSTLVNLISQLLFQNVNFGRGGAKKDFEQQFFPVGTASVGDSADGRITLETEDDRYELRKVWGAGSMCSLDTSDVTKRDPDGINEELRKILTYGKGVYSEMLLSSQKNTDLALQNLLDASQTTDAKQEITEVVSRAFAESGSVSVDALEKKIDKIIEDLSFNWDMDRDAPRKKATPGRHQKNIGKVLKAYYDLEDAEKVLETIRELTEAADRAAEECRDLEEEARNAEGKYIQFQQDIGKLTRRQDLSRNAQRADDDLAKWRDVLKKWPDLTEKLARARALAKEAENRDITDIYNKAAEYRKSIHDLTAETAGKLCPEDQEIRQIRSAQQEIGRLESSLCAMNIQAQAQLFGGHALEVTSVLTGEPVDITAPIREAVTMTIPGVLKMELVPADLDIGEIQARITEKKNVIRSIFDKYGTDSLEALTELQGKLKQAEEAKKTQQKLLDNLLGDESFETLQKAFEAIGENVPRTKDEIRTEIRELCGSSNAADFVSRTDTTIRSYTDDYESPEKLGEMIRAREDELEKFNQELTELEDILKGYGEISDPQGYLDRLKSSWNSKRTDLENAKDKKRAAAGKLDLYQESQSRDPSDEQARAEREYREAKELLASWIHIREKLQEQKDLIQEHPLEDLTKRFTEYLGIISGGRITSVQPDADKLNLNIATNQRPVGFDLLSEGTKDTVSLAFRLAVVDHLFPEGGGVIVLDDPLTDMDEERVDQACALIRKCAERHQVIFLTCREEYQEKLQGTLIRIG